jgi:hypothetical protein
MIKPLIHLITTKQSEIAKATAEGVPQTWDIYQRMVGECQGLQLVLDMINNLLEEERNSD